MVLKNDFNCKVLFILMITLIDYKENSTLIFIRTELLCVEVSHKPGLKNTKRKYFF